MTDQEAWLRLTRTDPAGVDNLGGWLTTVVARVCGRLSRGRGAPGRLGRPGPARAVAVDMAAERVAAIELTADPATLAAVELGPLRL